MNKPAIEIILERIQNDLKNDPLKNGKDFRRSVECAVIRAGGSSVYNEYPTGYHFSGIFGIGIHRYGYSDLSEFDRALFYPTDYGYRVEINKQPTKWFITPSWVKIPENKSYNKQCTLEDF